MTTEEMEEAARLAAGVESAVIAVATKHYVLASHAGLIIGNGHHMAQEIGEYARMLMLSRYRKAHGGDE